MRVADTHFLSVSPQTEGTVAPTMFEWVSLLRLQDHDLSNLSLKACLAYSYASGWERRSKVILADASHFVWSLSTYNRRTAQKISLACLMNATYYKRNFSTTHYLRSTNPQVHKRRVTSCCRYPRYAPVNIFRAMKGGPLGSPWGDEPTIIQTLSSIS